MAPVDVNQIQGRKIHRPVHAPNRRPTVSNPNFTARSEAAKPKKSILWLLVCVSCLTIQFYYTTKDYLKYRMTSEVVIQMETEFIPPALSFCFFLIRIRNRESFPKDSPCYNGYTFAPPRKCRSEMFKTDRYQLNQLMDMTADLYNSTKSILIAGIKHTSKKSMINKIDPFYKTFMKCLRIRVNTSKIKLKSQDMRELSSSAPYIMSWNGNFTDIRRKRNLFSIFIHEENSYPYGFEISYPISFLNPDDHFAFYYSYKVVRTSYLKLPYSSRCVDYEEVNLTSRGHCIENCVKSYTRDKNFTFIPLVLKSSDPDYFKSFKFDDKLLATVYSPCKKMCRLACNTNFYEVVFFRHKTIQNDSIEFVMTHEYPSISVVFSGKLSFLEYFIYVASLLSLWLGFSMLESSQTVVKNFTLFAAKKIRKKKIINQNVQIHHYSRRVSPNFNGNSNTV